MSLVYLFYDMILVRFSVLDFALNTPDLVTSVVVVVVVVVAAAAAAAAAAANFTVVMYQFIIMTFREETIQCLF